MEMSLRERCWKNLCAQEPYVAPEQRLELQAGRLQNPRSGLGSLARVIPTLVDGLRIASRQPTSAIGSVLYRLRLQATTEAELATDPSTLFVGRPVSFTRLERVSRTRVHEQRHENGPRRISLTVTVLLAGTGTKES